MKYWEIIANDPRKRGWCWGWAVHLAANGRTIYFADAHRDGGKRYTVQVRSKGKTGVSGAGIIEPRIPPPADVRKGRLTEDEAIEARRGYVTARRLP